MEKPKTIDEMALDFILHKITHPKDYSDYRFSKMRGRFGLKAAQEACVKAEQTARLMGLQINYSDSFTDETGKGIV